MSRWSPEEARVAMEIASARRERARERGAWLRAYELAAWIDRILDLGTSKPPLTRQHLLALLPGGTEELRKG